MMKRVLLTLTVLAATLLSACGYSTGTLVPDEYRTIAVPVFENSTRRHDLEWEVTRAVAAELQARTHLAVVDLEDEPDLVLRGTLVEAEEDTLSRRRFQRQRQTAYFVTAEIRVDRRNGESPLVEPTRVTERESYVSVLGEDVRSARQEAVRALAERVVQQLEAGW